MLEVLEIFDPYYEWLAIPRDQRPPTHYQLLGISPTERDEDVIDEAAQRQMALVQSHECHATVDEAWQIRNQISQARSVLLNPAKRRAYDASLAPTTHALAEELMLPIPGRKRRPPPLPYAHKAEGDPDSEEDGDKGPAKRRRAKAEAKEKQNGFPVVMVLLIVGGLVVGVLGGVVMWKLQSADARSAKSALPQKELDSEDADPAPDVLPDDKETKPGAEAPPPEQAPSALPKGKETKPGNDVSIKKDKEPTPAIAPKEKDSKPAAEAPAGTQRRWNLMPLVDLKVDIVEGKGKWHREDKQLICDNMHFVPRLQVRYVPPEEYDFSVTFTQSQLRNGVFLIMPKPGGGTFFWNVGSRSGKGYGFGPEGKFHHGGVEKLGLVSLSTMHTTTVQVRRDGVRGVLDGRSLIYHPTDFRDLISDVWRQMPNDRILGFGCDDPTTFHRVELVEITGSGKAIR